MKILISSIACLPFAGSEGIYGWRACRAIAELHEVWILTAAGNRKQIEEATRQGLVPASMRFSYLGEDVACHPNRMVARLQSWLSYQQFQSASLAVARRLHGEIDFDLAHLITFTTWRVACPLWQLGIPFIWGPISGTEIFPWRFFTLLSPVSALFEMARILSGWRSAISGDVRKCAREATRIVAIHEQAREHLARLRGTTEGIVTHSGWFFEDAHIAALTLPRSYNTGGEPLRMVAAGNLEGRKGIALALHALRLVAAAGVPFYYQVTSRGPELVHLRRLADRLGIGVSVVIGEAFPQGEFTSRLREFDICLLPSLREGGGLTMMEACLAGCVPIVADCGGPGDSVKPEFGFPVPVTQPKQMIAELANAILKLHQDRSLLEKMGAKARQFMQQRANITVFQKVMQGLYQEIAEEKTPLAPSR